jgi:hypothetical protein
MSTYIVTSPFTSVSGAHQVGAMITNAVEIAAILDDDDAAFVVHGADPSPTLTILTAIGMVG